MSIRPGSCRNLMPAFQFGEPMPNPDRSVYLQFYCRGIAAFDCRQWQLSIDLLNRALPGINGFDNRDVFLESHYCLAIAFENLGDIPNAEKHYMEVLAFDYLYKDVVARMERHRPS